jgi:hypothetical protein
MYLMVIIYNNSVFPQLYLNRSPPLLDFKAFIIKNKVIQALNNLKITLIRALNAFQRTLKSSKLRALTYRPRL